jgi:acyl-CoA reductase-like NAD-dependent aldehyde dehydrogenase
MTAESESKSAANRLARARTAQTLWAQLSAAQRAHALRPLRHLIAQRMGEILDVLSAEVGKPPMDALGGDVLVTLEQLRFYERRASTILRPRKIARSLIFFSGTRFLEVLEPHGVVLICAPWNYPLQLSVVPMATALFAGNAVLLKCSERTPRTAQLIAELCIAAGLPQDLVQVSYETPEDAAALLAAGPDLVFFTGSNRNGRLVATQAAQQMILTVMELGGKDSALIFDSCDLQRTVNGVAYGSFSNSGQVCVGIKRIYVQQPIYNEFLRLFVDRVAQLRTGTSVASDIGPIRVDGVTSRLCTQVEDALARGARIQTPWPGNPNQAIPVILTDVPAEASLLLEESFGPVVCIAPFQTEADAIAAANSSAFALGASVWTRNKSQAQRVARQLHSGSCSVNDVIRSIGNPQASFGGNQASGYGRYHGAEGLRAFSRIKTIMISTLQLRTEIHWFPFAASTFTRVRALLQFRHRRGLLNKIKALSGLWMLLPFLIWGLYATNSACPLTTT